MVSDYGYVIAFVTAIVYLVKAAIDYWFVTEIEKKLMTDYQKLRGFIAKMVITVIPSVCIAFFYMVSSNKNGFEFKESGFNENLFWITLLLMLFLLNIGMHLTVIFMEKLLNIKSDYFIKIDDKKWRIERLTKNNLLLLTNEHGEHRLIEDWINQNISKAIVEKSYTFKLYSNDIKWIAISITLIIAVGCFFAFALVENKIYKPLWFLGGAISGLSVLILLVNISQFKRNYH